MVVVTFTTIGYQEVHRSRTPVRSSTSS
jgi:hypothetical protein